MIPTQNDASPTPAQSLELSILELLADFPPTESHELRMTSGVDDPDLKGAPTALMLALLEDAIERHNLDRSIQQFINQLHDGTPAIEMDWQLQLRGLSMIWPQSMVLRVVDDNAQTLIEYGPTDAPQLPGIQIGIEQVRNGELWSTVLRSLSDAQLLEWLGAELPANSRESSLRRKVAAEVAERRAAVLKALYPAQARLDDPILWLIRARLPQLSTRAAFGLLAGTIDSDIGWMRESGEFTAQWHQDVAWYEQQSRVNRAVEGLYLDAARGADVDRLLLRMIESALSGPDVVSLELRRGHVAGTLLGRCGAATPNPHAIVVEDQGYYCAYTPQGTALHSEWGDIYSAIALALSEEARTALSLPDDQGSTLRLQLMEQPLPRRSELLQALGLQPVNTPAQLSESNGYAHSPPVTSTRPAIAQTPQQLAFNALAALNTATRQLLKDQPNVHGFAVQRLKQKMLERIPGLASTPIDPERYFINTFEEKYFWPLSDTGTRGTSMAYRYQTSSATLCDALEQRLAGKSVANYVSGWAGIYTRATDIDDQSKNKTVNQDDFEHALMTAQQDFLPAMERALESFWKAVPTDSATAGTMRSDMLRDHFSTRLRLEIELRTIDQTLDSNAKDLLNKVMTHPTAAARQSASGTVNVYQIKLASGGSTLAGAFVVSPQAVTDVNTPTSSEPSILYLLGAGLETFSSFDALRTSLGQRFNAVKGREVILDLLAIEDRPTQVLNVDAPFTYERCLEDIFDVQAKAMLAQQKTNLRSAWTQATGIGSLDTDTAEFARLIDSAIDLGNRLDVIPVLLRRNAELLRRFLPDSVQNASDAQRTQLLTLAEKAISDTPSPSITPMIPSINAFAANTLKSRLLKDFPGATLDPDRINVHITSLTLSAGIGRARGYAVYKYRTLTLTRLALENIASDTYAQFFQLNASARDNAGKPLSLKKDYLKSLVRDVDVAGNFVKLLRDKLLAPSSTAYRRAWCESRLSLLRAHVYAADLQGAFAAVGTAGSKPGKTWVDAVLQGTLPANRTKVEGREIKVGLVMLGGTLNTRNGLGLDGVFVVYAADGQGPIVLYTPEAPDGLSFRELPAWSSLNDLLDQKSWQRYFFRCAVKHQQADPTELFKDKRRPIAQYFPFEKDLMDQLYHSHANYLISNVEYVAASTERLDNETLWRTISLGVLAAGELILALLPTKFTTVVYLLRAIYGLSNFAGNLVRGEGLDAATSMFQAVQDLAFGLSGAAHLRPGLQMARLDHVARLTTRIEERRPLLVSEPVSIRPLRSTASPLQGYAIRQVPALEYIGEGIYRDPASTHHYVPIDDNWYRVERKSDGQDHILQPGNWSQSIIVKRFGNRWQPLPRAMGLGGGRTTGAFSRYEIPEESRAAVDRQIQRHRGLDENYPERSDPVQARAQHEFWQYRRKLRADAKQQLKELTLPPRPNIPQLPPQASAKALIEQVFEQTQGMVVGEAHSAISSKRLLIENMAELKERGIKTLYMEHLLTDFDQTSLDTFHETGVMPATLDDKLTIMDKGHMTDPAGVYTFKNLVRKAQEQGIRVQAIDCAASYYVKGIRGDSEDSRLSMFSHFAHEVILSDQAQQGPHKWVALVGNTHTNTVNGIPGLAELEGAIGVRMVDTALTDQPSMTVSADPGLTALAGVGKGSLHVKADLKVDFPVATDAPVAFRVNLLDSKMTRPGNFYIDRLPSGELQLVHRSNSKQLIRTPLKMDANNFYIEKPDWPDMHQKRFDGLPAFVKALKDRNMTQVAETHAAPTRVEPPVNTRYPDLTTPGMFLIEEAQQGGFQLVHYSGKMTIETTPIIKDGPRLYISRPKWLTVDNIRFDDLSALSAALEKNQGMKMVGAHITEL